jgi:epoxyqueuosine reductase
VLDATRCISYLTIEAKGEIPLEFRDAIGELVYGCDICQDVCPWNISFARDLSMQELAPRPSLDGDARTIALRILAMSDDEFRATFKGSAMKRAKLSGLKRNAAVVLGNVGTREDLPVLDAAMEKADSMVGEHISWARERIKV